MDYRTIIDFIRSLYPNRDLIPLHEPHFGGTEKKYVMDCIDSTFVSSVGKYVDRFEEMVHEYTGTRKAVATVNGTAALHIALLLAGVQPGDLVITQPLTFIATCNAISYCGAEPVFVDINRETLGLSPDRLENWLAENTITEYGVCYYKGVHELHEFQEHADSTVETHNPNRGFQQKTCCGTNQRPFNSNDHQFVNIRGIGGLKKISACVPMHTFGHPCEIDRIVKICDRYHIPVVEDSAESIGSYYRGQHTGTYGKLGILSFNGNKTITTGGGGMILTNDEELGKLAKHITTTAKKPHPWLFEHDMTGYNYRLPNINAAIGCAQMETLPDILSRKRDLAHRYQEFFDHIPEVEFVPEPPNSISNHWLNCILLSNEQERDKFLQETNNQRVMTRPAWILMNRLQMFSSAICGKLDIATDVAARLVNIPSSVRL